MPFGIAHNNVSSVPYAQPRACLKARVARGCDLSSREIVKNKIPPARTYESSGV